MLGAATSTTLWRRSTVIVLQVAKVRPLGESRVGQGGVCASPIPKIGQRHQEAVVEPNGRLVNPMPERTGRHTPIDIELLSDVAECLW
jgi:hypothetical protein